MPISCSENIMTHMIQVVLIKYICFVCIALFYEPTSSVFVFIFIQVGYICKDLKVVVWIADISLAADVAEGTIKKSFKDMSPHVSRLIPKWYAREEDITKICIF